MDPRELLAMASGLTIPRVWFPAMCPRLMLLAIGYWLWLTSHFSLLTSHQVHHVHRPPHDPDSRVLEGMDLLLRGSRRARNDGPRVAHPPPLGRGLSRDEP